jgi:murein DD-endopeptidase MepM/ murein hydrolase activator NlpD
MDWKGWLLVVAAAAVAFESQQRPPVVETVDMTVPFAPAIVQTGGKPILACELHLTNLTREEFTLTDVAVIAAGGATLASYSGGELRQRIGRPGLPRGATNPHVVGPGLRAVVYFWIELSAGSVPPRSVTHRVGVEVSRAGGRTRSSVEGGAVTLSATAPVVLDPPLRGGDWAAVYDPLLLGGHRTAIYTVGGAARIPGRFAIDWIRLSADGTIDKRTPRPPDWNGNGAEVLAVADATVATAVDDMPDNTDPPAPGAPPITPATASGNYIALDLGGGRFAFYEHLQHGSVRVAPGDRVKRGDVIGRLGNSGSSSIGPHLHFHVSDANSPLAAEGLPFVFRQYELAGTFESIDALIGGRPWRAEPGLAGLREMERPPANAVVRFR